MASKVTDEHVTPDVATVTIDHLDTDSFTRSVDRCAMAWARKRLRGNWALIGGEYAHTPSDRPRHCLSTLRFVRKAAL